MSSPAELPQSIAEIDERINCLIGKLAKTFGDSVVCYPFLLGDENITSQTVDEVFDDLQALGSENSPDGRLVVVVESGGGDIDAAYNLAMLFRMHGQKELKFVVPRWAKSAATLLVCAGDSVLMTPIAELGPLDPQITQVNAMEQRLEQFSPLDIESTLELIRNEFNQGNNALAEGLLRRLQFPITLGRFQKSLQLGRQYALKLLSSRMLKDDESLACQVSRKLVEDYADHGFCINIDEAKSLGLVIEPLSPEQQDIVWEMHKLVRLKAEFNETQLEKEMEERLRELPPHLRDALPPELISDEIRPDES